MRKNFKRLMAILLLVGLLASFIVPATFAENPTEPTAITYDFKLYENSAYMDYISAAIGGAAVGGHNLYKYTVGSSNAYGRNWFAGDFTQKINWVPEGSDSATGNPGKDYFVEVEKKNGLRIDLGKVSDGKRGWVALRLDVPTAATYQLDLLMPGGTDSEHIATGDKLNTYLFKATETYALNTDNVTQINQMLEALSPIGVIDFETGKTDYEFATFTFPEAGQYILVLQEETASTCRYIHLDSLTLTPETESDETEPSTGNTLMGQDTGFYFDLPNWDAATYGDLNGKSYATKYTPPGGSQVRVYQYLDGLYPNTLNWKHQESVFTASGGVGNIEVRANQGLRLKGQVGDWTAIRLNGIVAGTYDICLTSSGTSSMNTANAYLVKAASGLVLADSMTTDNLILSDMQASSAYTARQQTLEDGEYFLIIQHTAAGKSAYWCLTQLVLTAVEPGGSVPEETTEVTTAPTTEPTTAPTTEPTTQPSEPNPDAPPVMENTGNYIFDIVTAYPEYFGDLSGLTLGKKYTPAHTGKEVRVYQYLESLYPATLNWVHQESYFQAGGGVGNIQLRPNQGLRIYGTVGDWTAMKLAVPAAGEYNLKLTSGGSNTVNLYLMKYTEGMDIAAGMTEENLLIENVKVADASAIVEKLSLEASEYVLAIKHTSADVDTYWYLKQLELQPWTEKQPIPATDKMIYDLDLAAIDSDFLNKGLSSRLNDGVTRGYVKLAQMYENDRANWKYEGCSETFILKELSFRATGFRLKASENMNMRTDAWAAFRIKNPGTETYDVRIVSKDKSAVCVNIYIIPVQNTLVLTPDQIRVGMTKENLLVENAQLDDKGTFYLGEYTFGKEDEYVLVMDFIKGAAMHLARIEMTKDGLVADGTVKHGSVRKGYVYDFDLGDELDGIYTGSQTNLVDVLDDMNQRWADGRLNWKFLSATPERFLGTTVETRNTPNTNLRFYRSSGFRAYGQPDNWIALKIKSPGSGDFTVTLNHAVCPTSGTVAFYVLPADTDPADYWAATDPTNRIGKVQLNNKTGVTGVEDGHTSFVGYWNFEAGKEYVLVIEFYEPSLFDGTRAYMNISQLVLERGIIDYGTGEDEKRVSSITVLDEAVTVADAGTYGAVMEVNGHDWYFQSLEGGYMLVYDLDTRQLVDKVYTGHARSNCCVGPDGKVYAYAGNLVIYDPATGITEYTASAKTGAGLEAMTGFSGIAIAEDGTVWAGGSYGGYLFSYDVNTKVYTSYGMPLGYHNRMTGLIIKNGYIYAGIHGDGDDQIMKWEIATQKVVATYDITDMMGTAEYIQSLNFLGDDLLIAGGNGLFGPIVLNADLEPVEHNLYSYPNLSVSEEIDGIYYMMLAGYGLYQYDMATKEFSKVPGFGTEGLGFRTGAQNSFGKTLVTIDGDRCLITYSTGAQGNPRFFNLDTKEYQAWDDLVVHGAGGTSLRGFTNGQKGSNLIHFGGFNTTLCVAYNTEKGEVEYYYNTGGQTDCQIWYEGKLYAGNYSSTTLNEIYPDPANTSLPAPTELIQRWRLDHAETGQKRVHAIAAGDGYIFNGTVSDSNLLGGAVVVYDTRTGRWKYHRHAVENQTITALTYADGVLYGGSYRGGGSGSVMDPNTSAVIFTYDYKEMKVDAVLDPRDYISGLPAQIDYIASLEADPQVEGRIWAVVMETLFCFTYDKENKTFHVQEVISFSKDWEDESFQKKIIFDLERNYMYLAFGHHGGFQRIELENWDAPVGQVKVKSNLRVMDQTPEWYVMGEDGNIYFPNAADTGDLMMFPLNVTDEDWAIAEEVDNMFLAIGDEITLESEAVIKTARSAYENLSWRYKALIQNLEILQEAESDVLECKIDTLEGMEITADSFPAMSELLEEYKSLNARQQRYVKNYNQLKAAYDQASDLNDQRIAAAIQVQIDALRDKLPVTLEDEPLVLEIRAAVSALTGKQFILLDISLLEEAEAQIVVLRAEFVIHTESLIQAIPNEITLDAEPAILAAREAVDKLYTNERRQVSYSKLTSAEGKLRTLKNAKAKADPVVVMIDAIGTVWWNDAQAIAEARAAYEALSGTERTFVNNYSALVAAEERLALLQIWTVPVIAGGSAIVLLAAALVIFRKKIFKGKKKVIDN